MPGRHKWSLTNKLSYDTIKKNKGDMNMDFELTFWIVTLIAVGAITLWMVSQSNELYYEGRMDKIGGKGGR